MAKDNSIPQLRTDLEMMPTSYQGGRALMVRDSLGLIPDPVILQGDALNLLGLLDGKRTVRDIQVEFVRLKRGILVAGEQIEEIIRQLDSAYLLQSRRFQAEKDKILIEYARQDVRKPSHAGQSYPASPEDLSIYLNALLDAADGVGKEQDWGSACALMAPHIDIEIGKSVYAKAYRAIRGLFPQRIILLGTGHSLQEGFYCLTEKDFETPLGRVKTDRDSVQKLQRAGGKAVSRYDISHRREHSLEFQLIFLQHLFGSAFSLVPILCGSFTQELGHVSRPAQIIDVDNFLNELRNLVEEGAPRALVVAGADLSHIGPKFGHRHRASTFLLEAKQHDRTLLDALCRGDIEALWAESRRVGDRYNVCGFSTMASLLEIIPGAKGHCLDYDFWREESTQSAVSFAAVAMTVP